MQPSLECLEERNLLSASPIPNLGLTASTTTQIEGNLVAFEIEESSQGHVDLNGDGDTNDRVLHVYNAAADSLTNLGIGTSLGFANGLQVEGDFVTFAASEGQQGHDLNGDGDANDVVVHVYEAATGIVSNLGFATFGGAPLSGDQLGFLVSESAQGSTDLNGDGDTFDFVAHIHDLTNDTTTNLELTANPFTQQLAGDLYVLQVNESIQGGTDLNGDGDIDDVVLHVHDTGTGQTRNTGLSGSDVRMTDRLIQFEVGESAQGGTDLNGDGDTNDSVLHVYDGATRAIINFGPLGATNGNVGENLFVFRISELQTEQDLNGDGDTTDFVLHAFDFDNNNLTNIGLVAFDDSSNPIDYQIDRGRVAFLSPNDVGNVVHVYDTASGQVTSTNIGNRHLLDGDWVVGLVTGVPYSEMHVHNLSTGITTNLGLPSANNNRFPGGFTLENNLLVFGVSESTLNNTDLNGDGDTTDVVIHVYDANTGTIGNTALAPTDNSLETFSTFQLVGNILTVNVWESAQGEQDLNGDGDTVDRVLHVLELSGPFSDAPKIEAAEVGNDLQSITIQLNDTNLSAILATDPSLYHVLTANGDADGDGDFFNDGDELRIAVSGVIYDSATDRITLQLTDEIFADIYRLEIEGDDARLDGNAGLANENGFALRGGDFAADFDFRVLSLVEQLLTTVESLGLPTRTENSLKGRLAAASHFLGADVENDNGLTRILESFRLGVAGWFDRGDISEVERDDLFVDVDLILLGLSLTNGG